MSFKLRSTFSCWRNDVEAGDGAKRMNGWMDEWNRMEGPSGSPMKPVNDNESLGVASNLNVKAAERGRPSGTM